MQSTLSGDAEKGTSIYGPNWLKSFSRKNGIVNEIQQVGYTLQVDLDEILDDIISDFE